MIPYPFFFPFIWYYQLIFSTQPDIMTWISSFILDTYTEEWGVFIFQTTTLTGNEKKGKKRQSIWGELLHETVLYIKYSQNMWNLLWKVDFSRTVLLIPGHHPVLQGAGSGSILPQASGNRRHTQNPLTDQNQSIKNRLINKSIIFMVLFHVITQILSCSNLNSVCYFCIYKKN